MAVGMTVSATMALFPGASGISMQLFVLTGANTAAPLGRVNSSASATTIALSPLATGGFIFGGGVSNAAVSVPSADTTFVSGNFSLGSSTNFYRGKRTTLAVSQNIGETAATCAPLAAAEIVPVAGDLRVQQVPALAYSSGTAVTTDLINMPFGSDVMLVAVVLSSSTSTSATVTMGDSLGLTWTSAVIRRNSTMYSNVFYAPFVLNATVLAPILSVAAIVPTVSPLGQITGFGKSHMEGAPFSTMIAE